MPVELPVLLVLVLTSGVAGFVDAVAGGGGLIQMPVLAAALGGWTPMVAATNKVASICGTSAAVVRYARHGSVRWDRVAVLGPLALLGSIVGARLLERYASEAKDALKVIFAVCFLALGAWQVRLAVVGESKTPRSRAHPALGIAAVAAIGAYDGFVGPGTGILLFVVLSTWIALEPLMATGTTKAVNWITNAGALVAFIPGGYVPWSLALSMAGANLAGGWLGAHTAIRRGVGFIRVTTALVATAATLYLLLR